MTIDERMQEYKELQERRILDFGETFIGYKMKRHRDHCAANFPTMLKMLREALMDVVVINGNQKRRGFHTYTLLQESLEQTIAAAENVEGET